VTHKVEFPSVDSVRTGASPQQVGKLRRPTPVTLRELATDRQLLDFGRERSAHVPPSGLSRSQRKLLAHRITSNAALGFSAAGAFQAIRNLAAHEDEVSWSEHEALEHLAVLSVVARWITECTVESL
jgi:hypothetical protein